MIPAKQFLRLLKKAANSWVADYAPSMGAALSYYTLFSIAPLLLIVIAVAGLVFGDEAARGEIFGQLVGLIGEEGAKGVEGLVQAADEPKEGMLSTVIGVVVLIIGATTVFGELQNALDRIWRAPAREQSSGWWNLLRTRLLSFGMILAIAFLLMVSLVLSAAVSAIGKWFGSGGWEAVAHVLEIVLSFGLMTVLFALIYKFIPRVHIAWHDVWIGAAFTAVLLAVGKFLIGFYIGKGSVASAFGAAGSLVVVIVWVYYAAQIFLLGAEFTWVFAHEHGSRRGQPRPEGSEIEPTPQPEIPPARMLPVSTAHAANTDVPKTTQSGRNPLVLVAGAFAMGAALAMFKSRMAHGAVMGADILRRHSPLASRRRRFFALLSR
ncbi:MAG TPA: YihY/virulence factor BrkB family protein [Burkholderiales bacterium]|nr:YihY/virulence factor BrkB family protein [Burkholderiales bacterium]